MEVTICKNSQEDLKKLAFVTAIFCISFSMNFKETSAVYAAVFVQSLSNIETFWTLRENILLNMPTKNLITLIVISSFLTGLLCMMYWYQSYVWMECLGVKYIFVGIVMLPVLFWGRDFVLNNRVGK